MEFLFRFKYNCDIDLVKSESRRNRNMLELKKCLFLTTELQNTRYGIVEVQYNSLKQENSKPKRMNFFCFRQKIKTLK